MKANVATRAAGKAKPSGSAKGVGKVVPGTAGSYSEGEDRLKSSKPKSSKNLMAEIKKEKAAIALLLKADKKAALKARKLLARKLKLLAGIRARKVFE